MKRVLVTGARGFLGTHCLQALADRGWNDVHAVSRSAFNGPGATWHVCDLFDPGAVAALVRSVKPTHAIHLAWCTTPSDYWTSRENLRWITASLSLIEEFAHAGGRRLVVVGSCAEYDWNRGRCSEATTPLEPASLYGTAKNALQLLVSRFAPVLGISASWARIFVPYGPYENRDRLVAYVARSLLAGMPALCSSGEQQRDFLFAGDVANALSVLLESEFVGPVNVGSGASIAVKSVIGQIGKYIGRPDLIRLGSRPQAADEPDLLAADVTRLRSELAWRPRIELAQGIAASVEYWKQQG